MSAVATLAGPSLSLFRLAKEYVAEPVRRTIAKSLRRDDRRVGVERMQEVEERLLAAAIEHHPNRPIAMEHLLDAVERSAVLGEAMPVRVLPVGDVARAQRMEDLLLEAIVRTHVNGDAAIERLLGDVCGDAVIGDEFEERDSSAMRIDNDFDGMS